MIVGRSYLNSDAIATFTGRPILFWISVRPTFPAYIAVPQAITVTSVTPSKSESSIPSSEKSGRLSLILKFTVFAKAVGCS